MRLGFRARLTLFVCFMIFIGMAGALAFSLITFRKDKYLGLLENEYLYVMQNGTRLETLVKLAATIPTAELEFSKELLFVIEDPCNATMPQVPAVGGFSKMLAQVVFTNEALTSQYWQNLESVKKACTRIILEKRLIPIPTLKETTTATLLALVPTATKPKLILISMDGLGGSTGDDASILMTDDGEPVWQDDPTQTDELVQGAHLEKVELKLLLAESAKTNSPKTVLLPGDVLISVSSLSQDSFLSGLHFVSILSRNSIFRIANFIAKQVLNFALAILFLCLFATKIFSRKLTEPLALLSAAAVKLGAGDLTTRIAKVKDQEIQVVNEAFNHMTEKMTLLIDEAKSMGEVKAEIELAVEIQQMFLPVKDATASEFRLFSNVEMASKCGGDWWGYFQPEPHRLILLIGDVTGHGTASALVAGVAQGIFSGLTQWARSVKPEDLGPEQVLTFFNSAFFPAVSGKMQMSLFAAVIDTKAGTIQSSNAGHNSPYLITDEKISVLGSASTLIGLGTDPNFSKTTTHDWNAKSQLFLYTDGLIDCNVGETNVFDRRVLSRFIRANPNLRGKELLTRLWTERLNALPRDFIPPDDVTAVVCGMGDAA